jgi:hypothetical protein
MEECHNGLTYGLLYYTIILFGGEENNNGIENKMTLHKLIGGIFSWVIFTH